MFSQTAQRNVSWAVLSLVKLRVTPDGFYLSEMQKARVFPSKARESRQRLAGSLRSWRRPSRRTVWLIRRIEISGRNKRLMRWESDVLLEWLYFTSVMGCRDNRCFASFTFAAFPAGCMAQELRAVKRIIKKLV